MLHSMLVVETGLMPIASLEQQIIPHKQYCKSLMSIANVYDKDIDDTFVIIDKKIH